MAYDGDESQVEGEEGRYHFARSLVRGSRGIKKEYERGANMLREVIRETAERQTEGTILPADPASSGSRSAMLFMRLSDKIPDAMITTLFCETCHLDYSPAKFQTIEAADEYKSIWDLIEYALLLLDELTSNRPIPCKACKKPCTRFVDYHSFHQAANLDIVVRCTSMNITHEKKFQLLWMEPDGRYRFISEQEVPLKRALSAEMLADYARNYLKAGDLEKCAEQIKMGLAKFPTSTAFIAIAEPLIETSKIGLAEAIADQFSESHPNDPRGYACSAALYLKGYVSAQTRRPEMLELAEQMADKSLAKGQTPLASLAKTNIMRLKSMRPAAPVFAPRPI